MEGSRKLYFDAHEFEVGSREQRTAQRDKPDGMRAAGVVNSRKC